jgi:predicted nucleic acid-binding protein
VTPRGFLLDTNVLSELLRKRPNEGVVRHLHAAAAARLHTSAMSVVELRAGAARVPHGAELWARITRDVLARVSVLPIGVAEAELAGDFIGRLARHGASIGVPDALIGASAAANSLVLVTRNVRHLERLPVTVENWWE